MADKNGKEPGCVASLAAWCVGLAAIWLAVSIFSPSKPTTTTANEVSSGVPINVTAPEDTAGPEEAPANPELLTGEARESFEVAGGPPRGVGGDRYENMDKLTTYAVMLGRGIGCGIDIKRQSARVGLWLDAVAPPGSSDQQTMLPLLMQGTRENAQAQSEGRSPDGCTTVARVIRDYSWP